MPAFALALLILFALLAVGLRVAVQLRQTGATGFSGLRNTTGPAERVGGLLFAFAVLLCLVGPVLELAGALRPLAALAGIVADVLGVVLAAAGIALTLLAQLAMGTSWRIGVDRAERTALVTGGPFVLVRNPIYTATLLAFAGVALLAPDAATLAGGLLLVVALELHVRLVEEPLLAAAHGERYLAYARCVGRFVPGVGRLRASGTR